MRQPIDVKVKQMTRVGRAADGRMPFYSVTELGRDLGVTARSICAGHGRAGTPGEDRRQGGLMDTAIACSAGRLLPGAHS
jgi:hypothetical protein